MPKEKSQQDLLRDARERMNMTTAELAAELGKSQHTLRSWLLPENAQGYRVMPKSARLLLFAVVSQHRGKKSGR